MAESHDFQPLPADALIGPSGAFTAVADPLPAVVPIPIAADALQQARLNVTHAKADVDELSAELTGAIATLRKHESEVERLTEASLTDEEQRRRCQLRSILCLALAIIATLVVVSLLSARNML